MMTDISMVIKYWGVRGSIPAPLTSEQIREKQSILIGRLFNEGYAAKLQKKADISFAELSKEIDKLLNKLPLALSGTYGGDTTCVEVQVKDSPLIILDAGSGIRLLGKELMGRLFASEDNNFNPLDSAKKSSSLATNIHLLFSHYHWDHLQGFPFFGPAFLPQVKIDFYGKRESKSMGLGKNVDARSKLSDVLSLQQQFPSFPLQFEDMPCQKDYHEIGRLGSQPYEIGKAKIISQELTHPDLVYAYSIEVDDKKFVFATDTEHKDVPDPRLIRLAQGADILYYDSQYLPNEYVGDSKSLTGPVPKLDWGHSTYKWAIDNAIAADIKTVVLGHHEPLRSDFDMDKLNQLAQDYKKEKNKGLEVIVAYQGLEQRL